MKQLLQLPDYPRWLGGRAVSWFGNTVMILVLSIWVKSLTGSSAEAGLTMAFFMVPQLLAPVAGYIADKVPWRIVLAVGNVLTALALAPLLLVKSASDVWIIWLVTALYGLASVLLTASSVALQRAITPDPLLSDAQGLQQSIGSTFQLIGPLVGAGLFGIWGGIAPTLVAMVCFLTGAVLFATFSTAPQRAPQKREALGREMLAGLTHVWRKRELFDVMLALVLVQGFAGLTEGAMYSVTDTFDRPAEWVATIAFAQGIGMVFGALFAPKLIRRFGEVRSMIGGFTVLGLLILISAAAPNLVAYLLCVAVLGLFLPMVFVSAGSLQMRVTPAELMGRVTTAMTPLFSLASVGSLAVGAWMVSFWSFREIYPLIALGCFLSGLWLVLTKRGLRQEAKFETANQVAQTKSSIDPQAPGVSE